jgi:SAM-dependent methyltransferase
VIQDAVRRRVPGLGLPVGARVLDAPCGAGALAAALGNAGLDVCGADVETEAQAVLGEHFQQADLNVPLPWPDASFDAVFSIEGIEHLENRFGFLRELHRVLKPGGALILTTPNIVMLRSRVRFFASGFYHRDSRPLNEAARHPLHHIGLATFADLRYLLHTSGFRLMQVSHTHAKPISYLYAIFVPWMWLYTLIAFRKEKDPAQHARNREIRGALFSPSLLFGENLLLVARTAAPSDQ